MNKMGGSENEGDCNLKHRIIPKLTADKTETKKPKEKEPEDNDTKKPKETAEERTERISKVEITFSDFFTKCLDHEMLRLFVVTMFCFLLCVGALTVFYLVFVYFFKYTLWLAYFPTEEMIQEINRKTEL